MTTTPPPPRRDQQPIARTGNRARPGSRSGFLPFRTPVRGHVFAARPPGVPPPEVGEPVRLLREPRHPRDRWAIGVWIDGPAGPWRIGYLERAVAARLAPRIDVGEIAVVGRIDGWWPEPGGRYTRPVVALAPGQTDTRGGRGTSPASSESRTEARHTTRVRNQPPRSVRRVVRGSGWARDGTRQPS